MATLHIDKNRQVVPRWRRFINSAMRGENSPVPQRQSKMIGADAIHDVLHDWKDAPGIATAGDLVSVCVALGLEDMAKDAIDFLANHADVPDVTSHLVNDIRTGDAVWSSVRESFTLPAVRAEIAIEKARLRFFP